MNSQTRFEARAEIDGESMPVLAVRLRSELSQRFVLHLTALAEADRKVVPMLGTDATVALLGPHDSWTIRGIVTRAALTIDATRSETNVLSLTIEPACSQCDIGRDHRYFQDQSALDIIKVVLKNYQFPIAFEVSTPPPPRAYTVQWEESDWKFVERLCAEEGILYRFDFGESDTTLVFADDSTSAPKSDCPNLTLVAQSSQTAASPAVHGLISARRATMTRVTLSDYNPRQPGLDLQAEAGTGDVFCEYDGSGRYTAKARGVSLAQRRLDGHSVRKTELRGGTNSLSIRPGLQFAIDGAAAPLDKDHLTVVVSLEFAELDANSDPINIQWVAIPADLPFRPQSSHPAAVAMAATTAAVVGPNGKELHVDDAGYIRAQFRWDRIGKRDETASTTMRVGQFCFGNSMARPRIGWTVLVDHVFGDLDSPFVRAHLYDGEHPPPYPLPANKTRTSWQTATTPGGGSSNEMRFEDAKGAEQVFINASKDMIVAIGDAKTKKVGSDHTKSTGGDTTIGIGDTRSLTVASNQSTKISGSETITISANRSVNVTSDSTSTVGGNRTVASLMGTTTDADGGRSMSVGANLLDIGVLGINRAIMGSATVSVGSAWISAAGSGLANVTAGAGVETVSAAKLQIAGDGVALSVIGALAEAVGAAYVSAAGGNFSETASGSLSITVGGAFVGTAPDIEIEAESEISIVCGASSLTIKPGSIELRSVAVPMLAAAIAKLGGQVHHNQ